MQPLLHDVADFHLKFDLTYVGPLRLLEPELQSFRNRFLVEEFDEYHQAARAAWESSLTDDHANTTHHLENSLDALVDFVYVGMGTLYLHGGHHVSDPPSGPMPKCGPRALNRDWTDPFGLEVIQHLDGYSSRLIEGDVEEALKCLEAACYECLDQAGRHGFPFFKAWDRVHAANMVKIRAQRAEDSKRGSAYDVVKPVGWVAPCHKDLVEDHIHAG